MNRDDQLAGLLREAVSGIEPDDRLHEIHARTSTAARRRTTVAAVGGAVLASAAAVVAVAVLGSGVVTPEEPGPAGGPSASDSTGSTATEDSATEETPAAVRAVPVYYLGDTPAGVRLYREFRSVDTPDDGPAASLQLLGTTPQDPGYRTLWPADAFAGGSVEGDRITVELADPSLVERPADMTQDEAQLSVQQAVYTLQGYAQQRLPVEFTVGDAPADTVLGVPTPEPVAAAPALEVLSLVNLTRPEEGATAFGTISVEGVANSNEANVLWTLEDGSGEVVDQGYFTAEGWMEERLFPFAGEIDVSSLAPGSYTLVVSTEDASGGAEGPGAFTDDRTVVVE